MEQENYRLHIHLLKIIGKDKGPERETNDRQTGEKVGGKDISLSIVPINIR